MIKLLQGLRLNDWANLDRALESALKSQPGQPFLLLVKAWAMAQREKGREAEIIELLKQSARAGTSELLRPLADRTFAGALEDADIYDLLLEQPVARRRSADWDNLSRCAVRAGKPGEAIAHLKTAIEQEKPAGDDPERELRLVQLLLETLRTGEAVAIAQARAARKDVLPEDLVALAEVLHQWGARL